MAKPQKKHTIESLLERTEDYGDCKLWTGYTANDTPQVHHEGKMIGVRRLMYFLKTGKMVDSKTFISTKCKEPSCVNPDHLQKQNLRSHMSEMSKNVDARAVSRRIKLSAAAQARGLTKLTKEQVQEIFSDPRPGPQVAQDYGVTRGNVSKIRRGQHVAINLNSNNPFAGLLK